MEDIISKERIWANNLQYKMSFNVYDSEGVFVKKIKRVVTLTSSRGSEVVTYKNKKYTPYKINNKYRGIIL